MIKATLFYLLAILFLVQVGCKNDDDLNLNENIAFSNCLVEETVLLPIFSSGWCVEDSLSAIQTCEIIEIDAPFQLSDNDKDWLPYYCLGIGSPIYYHNESGEETSLVVTDRSYLELETGFYRPFCSSDSTLQTKYCFKNEIASVSFVSELFDLETTISLSLLVKFIDADHAEVGTQIQISSFQLSPLEYTTHFIGLVDNGSLSTSNMGTGVNFYPEITVLNQTFTNVYSYESNLPNVIPILYNKNYGIVSFIDKAGKKWVINK